MCIKIGKVSTFLIYPILTGLFYVCRSILYYNVYLNQNEKELPFLFRILLIKTGNFLILFLELISIFVRRNKTIKQSCVTEIKTTLSKYHKQPFLLGIIFLLSIISMFSIALNSYGIFS